MKEIKSKDQYYERGVYTIKWFSVWIRRNNKRKKKNISKYMKA